MAVGYTMISALAGCHLVTDNLFAVAPRTNERVTSIPFGRSRQMVNRKCSARQRRQALTRESGIAKRNLVPARTGTDERADSEPYVTISRKKISMPH